MPTKTYSERRQEAYFRAAVELYKLVVDIAEENIDNPPEGRENVSQQNLVWAASLIETTFKKATALEDLGREETWASTRQRSWVRKHRLAAEARTAEGRALRQRIIDKVQPKRAELDCDPFFASEAQQVFTACERVYAVEPTTNVHEGAEGVYLGRLDDRRAVVGWDTPSGEPFRETVGFAAIRSLYR